MPTFCVEVIRSEYGANHGFDFCDRSRGHQNAMPRQSDSLRRVVNQILGSISPASVVEKLDAQIPVESDHPIANLVQLVQQCPILRGE